jgi:hypothetical protein
MSSSAESGTVWRLDPFTDYQGHRAGLLEPKKGEYVTGPLGYRSGKLGPAFPETRVPMISILLI